MLLSLTTTVISVDDESLRTSAGCNTPSFSLTLYVDSAKLTFNEVAYLVAVAKRTRNTTVTYVYKIIISNNYYEQLVGINIINAP